MDSPDLDDEVDVAFMKELTPSPELAAIVGVGPMPRVVVLRELWSYIKEHKLQDPQNRRQINPDEKLKMVFGKNQVSGNAEIIPQVLRHIR